MVFIALDIRPSEQAGGSDAGPPFALRAGETDAESAFLAGRVDIEGDVQKAMQLAVAILADD